MRARALFKVAAVAIGIGALSQVNASPITVDQESVGPTNFLGTGGETNGQSFTPSFSAIDAAEFRLRSDGASSTLHLEVRQGEGLIGTLLGASQQITIGSVLSVIHFDLGSSVALTPGNPYTLVMALDAGDTFAGELDLTGNPYSGGVAINNFGNLFTSADFWFREGTHRAQVPAPATLALLGLGLAGLGWSRRRR